MRPLKGVVIGVSASALTIKLESGRIIEMPQRDGIGKWDAVLVPWDFTQNRPVKVYVQDPDETEESDFTEPEPEEQVDVHHEPLVVPEGEVEPSEDQEFWDSGFCGSPTVV